MENNNEENKPVKQEEQNQNQEAPKAEPVKTIVQEPVPNSVGVLVMGIISIVTCWCYGLVGITLGIIALVLASKAKKLYAETPEKYTEASYKNLKAGRVCAIIGTSLSGLYLLIIFVYILILGTAFTTAFSTLPWQNF